MTPSDETALPIGALRNFRRHPDKPGWWLFKERWFLGKVWEIPGNADMSGARQYFPEWPEWNDTLGPPSVAGAANAGLVLGSGLFVLWARRRWLDFHGRRVPRSVWRRARRTPWIKPE